jgi:predicted phosphoribosyltransferase
MREFRNRAQAGQQLAEQLSEFREMPDALVLGLPRGGVAVAYEVAHSLHLPLDAFVVRKIGAPYHPELALGAVASGGTYAVNRDAVRALRITTDEFFDVLATETDELRRREELYRTGKAPLAVEGKTIVLVDDGAATGSSMFVAAKALAEGRPKELIVALPVAPEETRDQLAEVADRVVCLFTPEPFRAVGLHYDDFTQVSDETVRDLLAEATRQTTAPKPGYRSSTA